MSISRPKPWESGAASGPQSDAPVSESAPVNAGSSESTAAGGPPAVPARPTSLNNVAPTTSYGGAYGGGYGGYSGYSSGFNGYGGYSGYGGLNSYGGLGSYGSFGSYNGYGGLGGYGSYGGGLGYRYGGIGQGMPGAPNPFQESTAATFQLIESIVGAFGGFAQMLESTYMATHSSFFAMVSVAEQFGHLKQSLGSILGIFAVLRWAKMLLAKLTGSQPPSEITASNFAKFSAHQNRAAARPRPSFKPLVLFLATVLGLPYLINRFVRAVAGTQMSEGATQTIDPSQLDFCRATYDFIPENPNIELEIHSGDLLAILSRTDPAGNPSQWWRVRSRDGRSGYIPSTYVQLIPRKPVLAENP